MIEGRTTPCPNNPEKEPMDIMEWAERVVTVPAEQADAEGLTCPYCCGPEDLRIREEGHRSCIERNGRYIVQYEAENDRLGI